MLLEFNWHERFGFRKENGSLRANSLLVTRSVPPRSSPCPPRAYSKASRMAAKCTKIKDLPKYWFSLLIMQICDILVTKIVADALSSSVKYVKSGPVETPFKQIQKLLEHPLKTSRVHFSTKLPASHYHGASRY